MYVSYANYHTLVTWPNIDNFFEKWNLGFSNFVVKKVFDPFFREKVFIPLIIFEKVSAPLFFTKKSLRPQILIEKILRPPVDGPGPGTP